MNEQICPECGHDFKHDKDGCTLLFCGCALSPATIEARYEAVKWYRRAKEARKMAAKIFDPGIQYVDNVLVSDGYELVSFRWCPKCGGDMQVVRPGDIRCSECGK